MSEFDCFHIHVLQVDFNSKLKEPGQTFDLKKKSF